jgi:hypothetical protein
MKAEYVYATAFPLIRAQSVSTYSKGSTEDDTLQEQTAFVLVSVFDKSRDVCLKMVVVTVAVMKRMGILDRFPPEREKVVNNFSF